MTTSNKITSPAVLNTPEAIAYCGGNSELFKALTENHGLIPVYENRTRKLYRVESIDHALLEMELVKLNQRQLKR